MARLPDFKYDVEFQEFLQSVPPHIQEIANKFPIDRLYFMRPDMQYVTIYGYMSDGSVIVRLYGSTRSFTIVSTENLTECEIPSLEDPFADPAKTVKQTWEMLKGPMGLTEEDREKFEDLSLKILMEMEDITKMKGGEVAIGKMALGAATELASMTGMNENRALAEIIELSPAPEALRQAVRKARGGH